jgi:predicted enzyme related to lactoylglutathione lyase
MSIVNNVVGWFEIPVSDMDRAIKFYQEVFQFELFRNKMGDFDMAWFPYPENMGASGAGGSLVYHSEFYKPSTDGTLVYFNSQAGDLNVELARVEAAGGQVIAPKTLISEDIGYFGLFIDTEGNRVALHSK